MLDVFVIESDYRHAIYVDGVKKWDEHDSPASEVARLTGGQPCTVRGVYLPELLTVKDAQGYKSSAD